MSSDYRKKKNIKILLDTREADKVGLFQHFYAEWTQKNPPFRGDALSSTFLDYLMRAFMTLCMNLISSLRASENQECFFN